MIDLVVAGNGHPYVIQSADAADINSRDCDAFYHLSAVRKGTGDRFENLGEDGRQAAPKMSEWRRRSRVAYGVWRML